jgi:hypothetical protein
MAAGNSLVSAAEKKCGFAYISARSLHLRAERNGFRPIRGKAGSLKTEGNEGNEERP